MPDCAIKNHIHTYNVGVFRVLDRDGFPISARLQNELEALKVSMRSNGSRVEQLQIKFDDDATPVASWREITRNDWK